MSGEAYGNWRLIAGLLLAARSSETVARAQRGQSGWPRSVACPPAPGAPGASAILRPACCWQGVRPHPEGVGRRPVVRGQPGAGGAGGGATGKVAFYCLYSLLTAGRTHAPEAYMALSAPILRELQERKRDVLSIPESASGSVRYRRTLMGPQS
jgi:hypothetical protein